MNGWMVFWWFVTLGGMTLSYFGPADKIGRRQYVGAAIAMLGLCGVWAAAGG